MLTHRCIPGSFGAAAHRDHISDNEFKVPKYLQRKIPSRKTIPSEAKQEWILACQQFLHRLTAVQPTDVEFRVRTYQLLCLPTAMLSLDDEDKAHNSRQRQRSLKERLAEVFLTDGEDLVFAKPEDDGSQISSDEDMDELYEDDAEEKRQDKHRKQRKTQRQAEKKIDKCVILAQMGAWHKALQTLQPSKLADSSAPEVQQLCRSLFPRRCNEAKLPTPPESEPLTILPGEVYDSITKLRRGAAPGLSGWTRELLAVLKCDNVCITGLAALLTAYVNRQLGSQLEGFLATSNLVPFCKDGVSTNKGVRPICLGEVFVKMCAHILMNRQRSNIRESICNTQFGVGKGVEKALIELEGIELKHDDDDKCLVKLDLSNAFNSVSRVAFLTELYANNHLRHLFQLVDALYGKPSEVLLTRPDGELVGKIHQEEGTRQGDVLALLLFCLGLNAIGVDFIKRELPHIMYVDDITLKVPLKIVPVLLAHLSDQLKARGLRLNVSKTQILVKPGKVAEAMVGASLHCVFKASQCSS